MKRFYKTVTIAEEDGGFVVKLDDHRLKTPEKKPLIIPTRAMTEVVKEEWDSQEDSIDPARMPMTKLLNTMLDRVEARRDEIIEDLVRFGGNDQLCYRANSPEDLVHRQETVWTPLLNWVKDHYDIHLKVTSGVLHMAQEPDELLKIRKILEGMDSYELTALHNITTLTGSLTIGLGLHAGKIDMEEAWKAGQLDETYQAEKWGKDEEAEQRRRQIKAELGDAVRFLSLMR